MRKIICPVDFSETSLNAIEFAAKVGEKHQSYLTLLYVFTEEEHNQMLEKYGDLSYEEWKTKVESGLAKIVSEVNKSSTPKGLARCDYTLEQGDLTGSILNKTNEGHYNLIVMGTTGASDVTDTYVGSNTVKVIEESGCPVLCVPGKATYHKFKKIVYASNYQEEDKLTIAKLVVFALPFKSELDILHVSHKDKLFEKALYEDFKEMVNSYVQYDHVKFTRIVYEDEVNMGIDQYVMQENANLLVLLTRHRNFFERLFHRSLTLKMSYFVDYPLLVFKMED